MRIQLIGAEQAEPGDVDDRNQVVDVLGEHFRDVDAEIRLGVPHAVGRLRRDVVAAELILQLVQLVAADDAAHAERGDLPGHRRVRGGDAGDRRCRRTGRRAHASR